MYSSGIRIPQKADNIRYYQIQKSDQIQKYQIQKPLVWNVKNALIFMFHSEFLFVGQRLFRYLLDVKISDELFFISGTNIVIKERKTTSALELSSSCCY